MCDIFVNILNILEYMSKKRNDFIYVHNYFSRCFDGFLCTEKYILCPEK